jgi:hypothetical protein
MPKPTTGSSAMTKQHHGFLIFCRLAKQKFKHQCTATKRSDDTHNEIESELHPVDAMQRTVWLYISFLRQQSK